MVAQLMTLLGENLRAMQITLACSCCRLCCPRRALVMRSPILTFCTCLLFQCSCVLERLPIHTLACTPKNENAITKLSSGASARVPLSTLRNRSTWLWCSSAHVLKSMFLCSERILLIRFLSSHNCNIAERLERTREKRCGLLFHTLAIACGLQ